MSSPSFSLTDTEDFMDLADMRGPLESPAAVRTSSAESETRSSATLPSSPFEGKKPDGPTIRGAAAYWEDWAAKNSLYKKHDRFYFDDGNITFLVDDILYRVHQYFLCRDSPHFASLVKNRLDSNEGEPTKSLLEPFILDDVNSAEFDAFLAILYPADFNRCEVETVKEWTSILRLASLWSFSSIWKLAIARLEPIASAVDKVSLGRTYGIDLWLVPGFVALCLRPSALSREEGHRLLLDDTILVASLREGMRMCNFHYLPEMQILLAVERCLALTDPWDASQTASVLADIDADLDAKTRAAADARAKADVDARTKALAEAQAKHEEETKRKEAERQAVLETARKAELETARKAEMKAKAIHDIKSQEYARALAEAARTKFKAETSANFEMETAREAVIREAEAEAARVEAARKLEIERRMEAARKMEIERMEAARKAEEVRKVQARKAEMEARAKAKADADVAKAEAEAYYARAEAEAETKAKAEAYARAKAEAYARAKAEADAIARAKAEANARAKAEADAKTYARKCESEQRAKAEAEAKAKAASK